MNYGVFYILWNRRGWGGVRGNGGDGGGGLLIKKFYNFQIPKGVEE